MPAHTYPQQVDDNFRYPYQGYSDFLVRTIHNMLMWNSFFFLMEIAFAILEFSTSWNYLGIMEYLKFFKDILL